MLRFLTLIAVSAASAAAPAAASQDEPKANAAPSVLLAPRFEQGDRLEYQFDYRSTVGRADGGATEGVTQRGMLRVNVLGVDETGAAAMTVVFPELHIEPDARAQDDEAEAARKLADELATAMRDVVLRLDVRPDGAVSSVTGLDAVHDIVSRHGRLAWPLLGPFAGEHAAEAFSELFRVDDLHKGGFSPRQPGDSWALVHERSLAPSTVLRTRTVWTLDEVADDAASLEARVERTMASSEAGDPAAATLTIADQSGELTARWSVEEGRLLERIAESQLDVRASLGDLEGPVVRATTRLQLRLVSEPLDSEQAAARVLP